MYQRETTRIKLLHLNSLYNTTVGDVYINLMGGLVRSNRKPTYDIRLYKIIIGLYITYITCNNHKVFGNYYISYPFLALILFLG